MREKMLERTKRPFHILVSVFSDAKEWIISPYFCCLIKFPGIKNIELKKKEYEDAKKLLQLICKKIRRKYHKNDISSKRKLYSGPILEAACQDAYDVVAEILREWPEAILCKNKKGCNIIQLATMHRSENIYNLINYTFREHSSDDYGTMVDSSENNILHLVGKLAPSNRLKRHTGAALQLQSELQWQQEVKNLVFPILYTKENNVGETPEVLFTREHENLVKEGEKWIKAVAESCSITAVLIITIVFAAAITVPGGSSQNGVPVFTNETAFLIFAISDAISLFSSVTALLVFLSILTSRFAEQDFLLRLHLVGLHNCHDCSIWCHLVPCLLSSKTLDDRSNMCISLRTHCNFFYSTVPPYPGSITLHLHIQVWQE
ncbi:hypothetical protein E3N88_26574 [Mikania micrantha]|uniref:PGG domain-containing protein n=1 Tax=Mikania micrantha TaxID=192012 RepID=A0A5N6MU54_9ASTR|nr:hypothetical protein E3N88_26574 [Mikania micrantha]